ncbi:MAG TPA: ABC transporter ATP-binding protein [Candidatus Thermoplasmatota archaeon]
MDAAPGAPIIQLDNVHKVYLTGRVPVRALAGVTLSIPRGAFVAVMGPSGCGKSTLLNLIGTVDAPSEGTLTVKGVKVASLTDDELSDFRRDTIGFVYQFFNLLPSLTAAENVELPLSFAGVNGAKRRERVAELLKMVHLEERADHTPSLLSGGEQQRVAIARCLANDPDIILLDEPTGDLDRTSGRQLMELLRDLNRNAGKTLVMVTHDPFIAGFASSVLEMVDGRIAGEHQPEAGA